MGSVGGGDLTLRDAPQTPRSGDHPGAGEALGVRSEGVGQWHGPTRQNAAPVRSDPKLGNACANRSSREAAHESISAPDTTL
jgi:hypothetical protein